MEYEITWRGLRVVRAVGVLVLTLVLAFFSNGPLFASRAEAAGHRTIGLRGSGSKGVVVIVPEKVETYEVLPETILVPVFVASESGRGRLTQVEMVFRGPGASTAAKRFIMDRNLEPAGKRLARVERVSDSRRAGPGPGCSGTGRLSYLWSGR